MAREQAEQEAKEKAEQKKKEKDEENAEKQDELQRKMADFQAQIQKQKETASKKKSQSTLAAARATMRMTEAARASWFSARSGSRITWPASVTANPNPATTDDPSHMRAPSSRPRQLALVRVVQR